MAPLGPVGEDATPESDFDRFAVSNQVCVLPILPMPLDICGVCLALAQNGHFGYSPDRDRHVSAARLASPFAREM